MKGSNDMVCHPPARKATSSLLTMSSELSLTPLKSRARSLFLRATRYLNMIPGQSAWHTATYHFLPTVFKNAKKPQSFPVFLMKTDQKELTSRFRQFSVSSGRQNVNTNSTNEMSEHTKKDGRHTASHIHLRCSHLRSELWHITLKKGTSKTLKKKKR